MKAFLILNLFLLTFSAFASNKSVRMNNFLKENGVKATGKRQSRDAAITCRMPRNESLTCKLTAGYSFIRGRNINIEFQDEKAIEISELLKEFDVEPSGRRHRQELDVECKFKGKGIQCESVEDSIADFG